MILNKLTAKQWIVVYALIVYIIPYIISLYLSFDFIINDGPNIGCSFLMNEYRMANHSTMDNGTIERYAHAYNECHNRTHPFADRIFNRSRDLSDTYINKSA